MEHTYDTNGKEHANVHFSTQDHYSMFLKLHSSELKFMVPWAQIEENKATQRSFEHSKLEIEESKLRNVLTQVHNYDSQFIGE